MKHCIVSIGLLLCCIGSVVGSNSSVLERLLHGYDKQTRPNDGGPPLEIFVSIYVQSFANIEETSMEYKAFMYFRMYWKDDRLAGKLNKTISLKGSSISNLWMPAPYCQNARESNLGDSEEDVRSLLYVDPDGQLTYSRLVKITAECLMDLREYPADVQKCSLIFGSYSYSVNDVVYKWKEDDHVTVGMNSLAQFNLASIERGAKNETYSTGIFSIIKVDFHFHRRLGYFIIQMYAPDIIIVMLSWVVFWMDRRDIGNRMALGITTILTIMFLMGSINMAMPKVSYPKALDWYLMVSFIFIFMALGECMLAYKMCDKPIGKGSVLDHEGERDETKFVGYRLDFVSRMLFPFLFFIYNIYYWIVYVVI